MSISQWFVGPGNWDLLECSLENGWRIKKAWTRGAFTQELHPIFEDSSAGLQNIKMPSCQNANWLLLDEIYPSLSNSAPWFLRASVTGPGHPFSVSVIFIAGFGTLLMTGHCLLHREKIKRCFLTSSCSLCLLIILDMRSFLQRFS